VATLDSTFLVNINSKIQAHCAWKQFSSEYHIKVYKTFIKVLQTGDEINQNKETKGGSKKKIQRTKLVFSPEFQPQFWTCLACTFTSGSYNSLHQSLFRTKILQILWTRYPIPLTLQLQLHLGIEISPPTKHDGLQGQTTAQRQDGFKDNFIWINSYWITHDMKSHKITLIVIMWNIYDM
jgi:hypothetical protein